VPVAREEQQKTGKRPPIVMKVDVEGAEYILMPALILSGALCRIDLIFVEWHGDGKRRVIPGSANATKEEMMHAFQSMRVAYPACDVEFNDLDDESYADGTTIPL
jgi:hypothetical protein